MIKITHIYLRRYFAHLHSVCTWLYHMKLIRKEYISKNFQFIFFSFFKKIFLHMSLALIHWFWPQTRISTASCLSPQLWLQFIPLSLYQFNLPLLSNPHFFYYSFCFWPRNPIRLHLKHQQCGNFIHSWGEITKLIKPRFLSEARLNVQIKNADTA